ncbi:alpha/beta hydrolase [Sphingosinicella sp. BN140058]|uniref:alpha/beta hydrolase n=1 Tax=Sphingosinicella sp. BN140058 TaxID=1892855 RepID=UPI0010109D97|nr:alpha/beta hydrolase [Sphingosinicella sp. BN140058]QAY78112.1 alpha/beta hydrolase [Sphingosinicella sp. BN140058]
MQDERTRAAIGAMGTKLGPGVLAEVQALYADEQRALAAVEPAADLPYGAHSLQRLDLYPARGEGLRPILVWVHGGGFLRGEKSAPDHPFNAHVGQLAARAGFLGAVIDYRLAPASGWPSGGEDVAGAVEWLKVHAAEHGGDPQRIVLAGTSAGSVHIATWLMQGADPAVRGAVLLSGLYGLTPLEERDTLYYGDPALYSERMPLDALVATTLPLFVACAEFDPPRFQAETLGLLQQRLARHGGLPRATIVTGHNHYSLACHLGSADTRLTDEIIAFARAHTAA